MVLACSGCMACIDLITCTKIPPYADDDIFIAQIFLLRRNEGENSKLQIDLIYMIPVK